MTTQVPLTLLQNNDGTYTVLSNIFNIVTEWDTLEEAVKNGKEALECHIEWLEKDDVEYGVYQSLSDAMNTYVSI